MPNQAPVKVFKNDVENDDSTSKKRQATPLPLILEAPRRLKRFVADFSSDENRYSADDSKQDSSDVQS